MDLSPYSPSERKLINECLVACSGDVGGALVEAQRRVLNKYRAEGQTTQAAVKKARPLFPNLFMT